MIVKVVVKVQLGLLLGYQPCYHDRKSQRNQNAVHQDRPIGEQSAVSHPISQVLEDALGGHADVVVRGVDARVVLAELQLPLFVLLRELGAL